MANEQVTQEELTKIQELNSEFNKAKMAIGDVELQKQQIISHIEGLKIQFSAHEKELIEKKKEERIESYAKSVEKQRVTLARNKKDR